MRLLLPLLLLTGCQTVSTHEACDAICDELVMTCGYEAYPTLDSCMQGCLYKQEEGGNMSAAELCIEDADCDTFEIIECEHAKGVDLE